MKRRHQPDKTELLARMPRAFRPKLTRHQLVDLGLCHLANLDAIASGQAEPALIWDYVSSIFTWWKVAQLLQAGIPEMNEQLEVATRLVERYGRTNRVRFDGPDLQLAKAGIDVMDQLAEIVDRPTAMQAVDWSEAEVAKLTAMVATYRQDERAAA